MCLIGGGGRIVGGNRWLGNKSRSMSGWMCCCGVIGRLASGGCCCSPALITSGVGELNIGSCCCRPACGDLCMSGVGGLSGS